VKRTTREKIPVFTVADHLHAQQQIEKRAHELWRSGGRCDGTALSDWLRAEREVLGQFVLDYSAWQPARGEPSRRAAAEAKGRSPKATILRQRPTNKSQNPLATTIPL